MRSGRRSLPASISKGWHEELSDRLSKYRWKRNRPDFKGPLSLPALVSETEAHLTARRTVRTASWRSLKLEASWTFASLGPELSGLWSRQQRAASNTYGLLPGLIGNGSGVSRLQRNVRKLHALTELPAAVRAAWRDVVATHTDAAAAPALREYRLRLFLSLAQAQGWSIEAICSQLAALLRGSSFEIALLRRSMGEEVPIPLPVDYLDVSLDERLAWCLHALQLAPREGKSIVYLAFDRARTLSLNGVSVGSVTFIDGMLLKSLLDRDGDLNRLPKELRREDPMIRATLDGLPDSGEFVLARVDLGLGHASRALQQAESVVEGLVALAQFHQGGTTWKRLGGFIHFLDGELSGHSPFHRPVDPPVNVAMDRTAEWLRKASHQLHPHSAGDGELKAAVHELTWLMKGQEFPDAQNLSLSLRIGDWASTALGTKDVWTLLLNHMQSWWIAVEAQHWLLNVAVQTASHLTGPFGPKNVKAERLVRTFAPRGITEIYLAKFVRLAGKLAPLTEDERLRSELIGITQIVSSPQEAKRWLATRENDFGILVGRAQRVRNSAIHGRPLESESVESSAAFLSVVVSGILAIWIQGILRGAKPVRWFRSETARVAKGLMSPSKKPVDVFFT